MPSNIETLIARFDAASLRHGNRIEVYFNGKKILITSTDEEATRELESLSQVATGLLEELRIDLPTVKGLGAFAHLACQQRFLLWAFTNAPTRNPDHFAKNAPRERTGTVSPGWKQPTDNIFRACATALESISLNCHPKNNPIKSSKKPKASINARMVDLLGRDTSAAGWTARQWANQLNCAPSMVIKTKVWNTMRMNREAEKAERASQKARENRRK